MTLTIPRPTCRLWRLALAIGLFLLALPAGARAQATPQGDTFPALPQEPGLIQRRPDVGYDPVNNVYLVVSANPNLRGRFVSANGVALGSPFHVDQRGATQLVPRVAWSPHAGTNGGFLVTWLDYQFTDRGQVWGRLIAFGTGGAMVPITNEFMMSDFTEDVHPEMGAAVAYSTGSQVFLVTWRDQAGLDIRGQRINNTGAKVGSKINISGTPYWEAEPSVTYNPDRDEFLVVYFSEPVDGAGVMLSRPVRASDGALVRAAVAFGGAAFATLPQVEYDSVNQRYLAAYFAFKPGPVFEARWLLADGTPDPNLGLFPLATGFGSYDGFQLSRNVRTRTYFAAFHGSGAQDMGVEVSATGVPSAPFQATFSCPTCQSGNQGSGSGNFNPRLAPSTQQPDWLLVASRSFTETVAQRFRGTAVDGPPPPPPPPPGGVIVQVDQPGPGSVLNPPFAIAGWAIDTRSTSGPGVGVLHIWAIPHSGATPVFVGLAPIGTERLDVAAVYGQNFKNSGYGVILSNVPPGRYTLVFYPFSMVTGQFEFGAVATRIVDIIGSKLTQIDQPGWGQVFTGGGVGMTISGWALDLAAPAGTGIDVVHVWALDAFTSAPTFLGAATYGITRNDVAAMFGGQFVQSGYSLSNGVALPPSTYYIAVFSHSPGAPEFNVARIVGVIIQ